MSRLPLALALLSLGCTDLVTTPVGVTLDDGQVLIGDITTEVLHLDGGLGELVIPLDDVGVVLPVEGTDLDASGGFVRVWLRNGTELTGRWDDPQLELGLTMGGETVNVDLPMSRVQAVQTQGSEIWSDQDVYRVRTTHGDDFLVDPDATRIALENELGTFAPFLSECRAIGPIGDPQGDWRIELDSGTVLIGPLAQSEVVFALPMGPDEVVVPLELFVSLDREYWHDNASPINMDTGSSAAPRARPALSSSDGWFDYSRQYEAKKR